MVCINNVYHKKELTIGKIYDFQKMTDGDDSAYLITNDLGEPWVFGKFVSKQNRLSWLRFVTLEEWRNKQIDKIL